jgi:hypothetical protein
VNQFSTFNGLLDPLPDHALLFDLFGALLLDFGFVWLLFPWQTTLTWQALFHLAFFLNTIFFVIFPFLLFLGYWTRRGLHKELLQRRHQTRLKQAKDEQTWLS